MGIYNSKLKQQPLTAEDIKRMKETMKANLSRDRAVAYDNTFNDFIEFAIESFNSKLTKALKSGWEQFCFTMGTDLLDVYITDKYLRNAELDKEWLYRCSNFYIKTYPDFDIKHELDESSLKMTYTITMNPIKPKLESISEHAELI